MHVPLILARLKSPVPGTRIELQFKLPLLGLLPLAVAAIFLPDRVWNTMLVGFGGMFLISYLWMRQMAKGLHGARRLRFGWVSVGDQLEEEFELWNSSLVPAIWVEVVDYSNVPGYQVNVVRSVGELRQRWRQTAICQQRGQFHLGPWAIRSSDPFGLFIMTHDYLASEEIIIHPPIHGQLPIPLPVGQRTGRVRARQRAWRATVNAAGVRDYHPQDPYQWIHWPTTARKGELHVREFDLDAAGEIWLLVDLHAATQVGTGMDGTEEHAVLLAASLAARGLSQNRPMGIVSYGKDPQIVTPGRGEGQRWRILRALALVQADGRTGLSRALRDLSSRTRHGTAAVIITAADTADWLPDLLSLAQKGVQSHVILLDRASFGAANGNDGLHAAIRRLGIESRLVQQGDVGQPLATQERRGYWEFKVTGTGKVVAVNSPLQEGRGR